MSDSGTIKHKKRTVGTKERVLGKKREEDRALRSRVSAGSAACASESVRNNIRRRGARSQEGRVIGSGKWHRFQETHYWDPICPW